MKDKEVYGKLKVEINVKGIDEKIRDRIMRKLNRGFGIDGNYIYDMDDEIIVEEEDYFNIDELRELKDYLSEIAKKYKLGIVVMDFYIISEPSISYIYNNLVGEKKEVYKEGVKL